MPHIPRSDRISLEHISPQSILKAGITHRAARKAVLEYLQATRDLTDDVLKDIVRDPGKTIATLYDDLYKDPAFPPKTAPNEWTAVDTSHADQLEQLMQYVSEDEVAPESRMPMLRGLLKRLVELPLEPSTFSIASYDFLAAGLVFKQVHLIRKEFEQHLAKTFPSLAESPGAAHWLATQLLERFDPLMLNPQLKDFWYGSPQYCSLKADIAVITSAKLYQPMLDGETWDLTEIRRTADHIRDALGGDPSGRLAAIQSDAALLYAHTRNEGAFAVRPGLAFLDGLLFDHNPNIAGPSGGPVLSQYESLGPQAAAGQGIPPIAPLPSTMHAEIIFNGRDQRPMIRYEQRSGDSANPAHIDQSLTGSRLRTIIQRDFFSLPPDGLALTPARGLVETADGVFYRLDLPPAQDTGSAPVSMVRLDSVADAAEIAKFTTQETTEHWIRTSGFSLDIRPEDTNLYLDIVRNSNARALTLDALRQEIVNRQRFGEHSTVVADALVRCMEPTPGGAAPPSPEEVGEALSAAMSAIARSPEMTREWRNAVVEGYSGRDPGRNPNMHFEAIHVAPAVPDGTGIPDFLDHELRRSLDLFSEIYEGLDFSHIFQRPAPGEAPPAPGTPNWRIEDIHKEFGRVIGQRRNVAIAVATLRDGTRVVYHALSGTQKPPAFTSHASRNPQSYIYVDTGEGRIAPPLPHTDNLTPQGSPQKRGDDTEQLLADRVLRDHQDEIRQEGETEKEHRARTGHDKALRKLEIISLLEICWSCAPAMVDTARRLPHAEFVYADFPAPAKNVPAHLKRTSPRPLRSTARPTMPATRIPVHA